MEISLFYGDNDVPQPATPNTASYTQAPPDGDHPLEDGLSELVMNSWYLHAGQSMGEESCQEYTGSLHSLPWDGFFLSPFCSMDGDFGSQAL